MVEDTKISSMDVDSLFVQFIWAFTDDSPFTFIEVHVKFSGFNSNSTLSITASTQKPVFLISF